jgi:hypothetical protein
MCEEPDEELDVTESRNKRHPVQPRLGCTYQRGKCIYTIPPTAERAVCHMVKFS